MIKTFLFTCFFLALVANTVHSQAYMVDPTFANAGFYTYTDGATQEVFNSSAVQSDGKIIAVGTTDYDPDEAFKKRIIAVRLLSNGQLDNSFGTNGKVVIDFPQSTDVANAVAILPSGKIVIAGQSEVPSSFGFTLTSGVIYRLNANGSLDNSYGSNGRAFVQDEVSEFRNIAILDNGKIAVSGYSFIDTRYAYIVARFNDNGQLDNTFNNVGFVEVRTSTSSLEEDNGAGFGLAIQPDGRIVTCGYDERENGTILRFTSTGQLDNTFGFGGISIIDFDNELYLYSVVVDSEGKIVIAGVYDFTNSISKANIMRLLPNGNFDNSFSNFGFNWYGDSFGTAYDIKIQPDGKYLVVGLNKIMRINNNGDLDTSFDGQDGIYTITDLTSGTFVDVHLFNNYIYVTGWSINSTDYNAIVARLYDGVSDSEEPLPAVENLKVFPNPVIECLNLQWNNDAPVQWHIYNQLGQLVHSGNERAAQGGIIKIETVSFQPGLYTLRYFTSNATLRSVQFVKM